VSRDIFTDFASYIYKIYDAYLELLHASDERQFHKNYRIYIILSVEKDQFITISTDISPSDPKYKSLTPSIFAANLYEREINDFFGIQPEGHPDTRPWVLYDNWSKDVHPLRKDFKWNQKVPKTKETYEYRHINGEGIFEIPVGPVHAGIIEPGHFRFSVAGEPIINLETRLGYVHKGIEKLSEQMSYDKGVSLAERISGDNSFSHAVAYCSR
jgi:Ni,Fe-hydrogenase III component G